MEVATDQKTVISEDVDAAFDLVIGDLEKEIPPSALNSMADSGSGTACGSCSGGVYCC